MRELAESKLFSLDGLLYDLYDIPELGTVVNNLISARNELALAIEKMPEEEIEDTATNRVRSAILGDIARMKKEDEKYDREERKERFRK